MPGAIAFRVGERAAHASEELRLDHALGDGRQIHPNERAVPPIALLVDSRGEHLFADPTLAEDQRGRRRRRGHPARDGEGLLERTALHHRRRGLAVIRLVRGELPAEPRVLLRAIEARRQVFQVERFLEKVERASMDRVHCGANFGARSHHQDDRRWIDLERSIEDAHAFAIREVHVEQHSVEVLGRESPRRRSDVADARGLIAA